MTPTAVIPFRLQSSSTAPNAAGTVGVMYTHLAARMMMDRRHGRMAVVAYFWPEIKEFASLGVPWPYIADVISGMVGIAITSRVLRRQYMVAEKGGKVTRCIGQMQAIRQRMCDLYGGADKALAELLALIQPPAESPAPAESPKPVAQASPQSPAPAEPPKPVAQASPQSPAPAESPKPVAQASPPPVRSAVASTVGRATEPDMYVSYVPERVARAVREMDTSDLGAVREMRQSVYQMPIQGGDAECTRWGRYIEAVRAMQPSSRVRTRPRWLPGRATDVWMDCGWRAITHGWWHPLGDATIWAMGPESYARLGNVWGVLGVARPMTVAEAVEAAKAVADKWPRSSAEPGAIIWRWDLGWGGAALDGFPTHIVERSDRISPDVYMAHLVCANQVRIMYGYRDGDRREQEWRECVWRELRLGHPDATSRLVDASVDAAMMLYSLFPYGGYHWRSLMACWTGWAVERMIQSMGAEQYMAVVTQPRPREWAVDPRYRHAIERDVLRVMDAYDAAVQDVARQLGVSVQADNDVYYVARAGEQSIGVAPSPHIIARQLCLFFSAPSQ